MKCLVTKPTIKNQTLNQTQPSRTIKQKYETKEKTNINIQKKHNKQKNNK
jgi:hypothetical protein